MKITETWNHKKEIFKQLREKKACENVLVELERAETEEAWLAIGYANFSWGVKHNIIEEWLPAELPNCTHLHCWDCTGLTALPELPSCTYLDCGGCTGLTALPELPNCTRLFKN